MVKTSNNNHPKLPGLFQRFGDKAGALIDSYWPTGLSCLSVIGLVFIQSWLDSKNSWLILLSAVTILAFIFSSVVLTRNTARVDTLDLQNKELKSLITGMGKDYFEIWKIKLGRISDELGFGDTERISLYKYSDVKEVFVMIGRYSLCDTFSLTGRGVYPKNEGCIAKAWESGDAFVNNLPDPTSKENEYLDRLSNEWKIKESVARNFKMKSRSIFAFPLTSLSGLSRIAVMVVESTKPNQFSDGKIKSLMSGQQHKEIITLIESLKNLEPSMELAEKEGF